MFNLKNVTLKKLGIDRQNCVKPPVAVKVVGVGGGGCNALTKMVGTQKLGIKYLAVNTDTQALGTMNQIPTFAIGPKVTGGLGSGGNAKIGKKAIRESQDQVGELLSGVEMVFITAGMGGGTGTGAAPVIADIAKKCGILSIAVVTTPFSFEGTRRKNIAEQGIISLRQKVDTLITIDNDRLISPFAHKVSLEEAFQLSDSVLGDAVNGIWNLVNEPGFINVDFADIRSIIKDGGSGFISIGHGNGENSVQDAVKDALNTPLFRNPIEGSSGIIMNVRGGLDMSLDKINDAANLVTNLTGSETQLVFGVVKERRMKNKTDVILLATGTGEAGETSITKSQSTLVKKSPTISLTEFTGESLVRGNSKVLSGLASSN